MNKEILRLAVPSIFANLTVPLVGMADLAIAGHLNGPSAILIAAVSVGSMLFDILYWNFGFLRAGTGGLTAQAYGRQDMRGAADILSRSLGIAWVSALVLIVLQTLFLDLAFLVVSCSDEAGGLAERYFRIRIWAAPATLSLMALRGWFIGMQDSVSSMWTDGIVNVGNVLLSLALSFGGMGFDGIAWGTLLAQYAGLLFAGAVLTFKYGRRVFSDYRLRDALQAFRGQETGRFFRMNGNLFLRSLAFMAIYFGYTVIAARYGDLMLAAASILMKLLLIFSYFTDGFAYAGEALTGRFIGAREIPRMRQAVRRTFVWSLSVAGFFLLVYGFGGEALVGLMSSDAAVRGACRPFLPWLLAMPLVGCAAFTWDGIYIGATETKELRRSTFWAVAAFFGVWLAGLWISGWRLLPSHAGTAAEAAIHLLLGAYFAHLAARTLYLSLRYPALLRSLR